MTISHTLIRVLSDFACIFIIDTNQKNLYVATVFEKIFPKRLVVSMSDCGICILSQSILICCKNTTSFMIFKRIGQDFMNNLQDNAKFLKVAIKREQSQVHLYSAEREQGRTTLMW